MFKGSNVALITPFKNNKIDEEKYINLINFHLENGTNGLVPAGTTGVSPTLSHTEHEKVIELCINEVKGKIVLFNAPFTSYGKTVRYRYSGASAAAKHGAVASLIRSVGPWSMNTPHTGVMAYKDGIKKIPHAALTMEDALMMGRLHDQGEKLIVKLEMDARMAADR